MSTTKLIVLITCSVLLVCLICVGIIIGVNYGKNGGFGFFGIANGDSFNVDESAELDLSGIESINVECVSGKINIVAGEPGAMLKGNIITTNPKDQYLVVTKSDNVLTVKFDSKMTFPATISTDITLDVRLPKDVLTNLSVSGASADTDIIGLELMDIRISSASGAARITDCTGGNAQIDVASGRIEVRDSDIKSADLDCISGDITVENITGSVSAGNTSGTVNVTNAKGAVSVSNTSGGVFVTQTHDDISPIHVSVVSGGVKVNLPPKAAFDISAVSTSGGFHTDFDVTVSGSMSKKIVGADISGSVNGGGALVELSTVSGGISVQKTE